MREWMEGVDEEIMWWRMSMERDGEEHPQQRGQVPCSVPCIGSTDSSPVVVVALVVVVMMVVVVVIKVEGMKL